MASNVSRVTVTLPLGLLEKIDRELTRPDESRSAAVRRLLEEAIEILHERAEVERYVRGYREQPQTEEEFGWQSEVAKRFFADHP